MKLTTFIVFAILSICLAFSDAKPVARSQGTSMEDYDIGTIVCSAYDNDKCTGNVDNYYRQTSECLFGRLFMSRLYEKIEFNSYENITVYVHGRSGCSDEPQRVTDFTKGTCKWDETLKKYVVWNWF